MFFLVRTIKFKKNIKQKFKHWKEKNEKYIPDSNHVCFYKQSKKPAPSHHSLVDEQLLRGLYRVRIGDF